MSTKYHHYAIVKHTVEYKGRPNRKARHITNETMRDVYEEYGPYFDEEMRVVLESDSYEKAKKALEENGYWIGSIKGGIADIEIYELVHLTSDEELGENWMKDGEIEGSEFNYDLDAPIDPRHFDEEDEDEDEDEDF